MQRGPKELNFEVLEMQKWNMSTDRAQRVDEKNGVICVQYQQWLIFCISADDSKKSVTVWSKCLSVSERSYLALLENAMDYWVLSYH